MVLPWKKYHGAMAGAGMPPYVGRGRERTIPMPNSQRWRRMQNPSSPCLTRIIPRFSPPRTCLRPSAAIVEQPDSGSRKAAARSCARPWKGCALRYRWVIEKLDTLLVRRTETLHIVGGGSQNQLLNRFAADATQVPVVVGPVEATAAGNIAMQAVASGELASPAEARQISRNSFEIATVYPGERRSWDEAYRTFVDLLAP